MEISNIRAIDDIKSYYTQNDKNTDGKLDKNELGNELIKSLDRDGDSKLSPWEVMEGINQQNKLSIFSERDMTLERVKENIGDVHVSEKDKTSSILLLLDNHFSESQIIDLLKSLANTAGIDTNDAYKALPKLSKKDLDPDKIAGLPKAIKKIIEKEKHELEREELPEIKRKMFRILLEAGTAMSNGMQEPYDNWQNNYLPPGGSMTTSINHPYHFKVGLEFEPSIPINSEFSLGIPIYYYPESSVIEERTVDWWDPVPLTTLELHKTSPGVGISLRHDQLKLQLSVQKYEIVNNDWAGDDVSGGINCAHIINSKTIGSGLGLRFDVRGIFLFDKIPDYGTEMMKSEGAEFGMYFEFNGGDIFQLGMTLGINLF